MMHAIQAHIVTPTCVLYDGFIVIKGDRIVDCYASALPRDIEAALSAPVDTSSKNMYVIPGFVDIHNHGMVGGSDILDHWLHPRDNLAYFARYGVTSVVASVIFSSTDPDKVVDVIASIEGAAKKVWPDCAVLEGIHAEGPIIASSGGLPPCPTEMSLADFKALCATMPSLRIMTISPSKEAGVGFARLSHLLDIGVRPSLGHDRLASEQDVLGALSVAARVGVQLHSTHMYNVMAFHHSKPSLANFVLVPWYPNVDRYHNLVVPTVEMIVDNVHVHPVAAMTVLSTRRTADDVCAISDCIAAPILGTRFNYNGRGAEVRAEGAAFLCDSRGRVTTTLAGSTSTVCEMFRTLQTQYGLDVVVASRVCSTTPARVANIGHEVGALEKGKYANLVVVETSLSSVVRVMVRGRWLTTTKQPQRILTSPLSNL
eukprot:PhM_4_TR10080/c1_g1_i2/m.75644/K01443/nagA, AMDHD2; N-acetylglucosamine-6-phosphate deacetylase